MNRILFAFRPFAALTLCLALLTACGNPDYTNLDLAGMFHNQSPDTDTRFSESMAYNASVGGDDIALTAPVDDYLVYVCTDSHVDSTTHNLGRFVEAFKTDPRCAFALHLGDMINAQNHYPTFDSCVNTVPAGGVDKPLYKTAGNHDLYFGQWTKFRQFYHTSTYTITVTTPSFRDRIICLDSGSGTLGVKELRWLRTQLESASSDSLRHIVIFTHTHIFKQDHSQGHTSNYNMEETTELLGLMEKYGVELVLMGHDHNREITRYGRTTYIIVDSIQDRQERPFYMILDMDRLDYRFVELPRSTGGIRL